MKKKILYRVVSALILTTASLSAQAQLINFDLTGGSDSYGPGAAVFGAASSTWNTPSRIGSATNLALLDDTSATTSVTVSYVNTGLIGGGLATSGTYNKLGISAVSINGAVNIAGLSANAIYQLAVFVHSTTNNLAGTITTNGITHPFTTTSDWSILTVGSQYALFNTTADSTGHLQFTTSTNVFTAWQLQSGSASVPEPALFSLLGLGLAGLAVAKKRKAV